MGLQLPLVALSLEEAVLEMSWNIAWRKKWIGCPLGAEAATGLLQGASAFTNQASRDQ